MRHALPDGWLTIPLVLSRYLTHLELGEGQHLLTHGVFGHPFRVKTEVWNALAAFASARTLADAAAVAGFPEARLARVVETLLGRAMVVAADVDEEAAVRRHFQAVPEHPSQAGATHQPAWVGGALPAHEADQLARERCPLRVVILGACFTHAVETLLVERGLAEGFDLEVHVGPSDGWAMVAALRPDVVIYQMPGNVFLRPLLDHFQSLKAHEVVELLQTFLGYVEFAFGRLAEASGDALVLVHGYALPQHSPLGVLEGRAEVGFFEALRAANQGILDAARRRAQFHYIDEDRLFGNQGKRHLQDDMLNLYSHHGGLDYAERVHGKPMPHEPSIYQGLALEPAAAEQALVTEYLTVLRVHRAPQPIKCVVVDLDGTLWPGAIGDETFDFAAALPWLTQFRHAGLHQALKILKARGIVLAIATKNNPNDVLNGWRYPLAGEAPAPGSEAEHDVLTHLYRDLYSTDAESVYRAHERHALLHLHLLRPEDFVVIQAGWEPKSQMLRTIAETLNLGLGQLAFLDDSPIERAEVSHHLPEVWVLEGDPNRWREILLSSPRFQVAALTEEAARRTELTSAQLRREAARADAPDPHAFLASLELTCMVRRETDETQLGRIQELLARTNQMTLTTRRHDLARLRAFLADPEARLYTLGVRDRFTSYGLVGVAIVVHQAIDTFALSCRVMGLGVEDAFLSAVLAAERSHGVLTGRYLPTDRNMPIAGLLPRHGFVADEAGNFTYTFEGPIANVAPHCRVLLEEATSTPPS